MWLIIVILIIAWELINSWTAIHSAAGNQLNVMAQNINGVMILVSVLLVTVVVQWVARD